MKRQPSGELYRDDDFPLCLVQQVLSIEKIIFHLLGLFNHREEFQNGLLILQSVSSVSKTLSTQLSTRVKMEIIHNLGWFDIWLGCYFNPVNMEDISHYKFDSRSVSSSDDSVLIDYSICSQPIKPQYRPFCEYRVIIAKHPHLYKFDDEFLEKLSDELSTVCGGYASSIAVDLWLNGFVKSLSDFYQPDHDHYIIARDSSQFLSYQSFIGSASSSLFSVSARHNALSPNGKVIFDNYITSEEDMKRANTNECSISSVQKIYRLINVVPKRLFTTSKSFTFNHAMDIVYMVSKKHFSFSKDRQKIAHGDSSDDENETTVEEKVIQESFGTYEKIQKVFTTYDLTASCFALKYNILTTSSIPDMNETNVKYQVKPMATCSLYTTPYNYWQLMEAKKCLQNGLKYQLITKALKYYRKPERVQKYEDRGWKLCEEKVTCLAPFNHQTKKSNNDA